MKKTLSRVVPILMAVVMMGSFASSAFAQTYIHANGGTYWSQTGSGWNTISNDGYCVSGRGPCGSSLWYLQWNSNHGGCGSDATGNYTMASVVNFNGNTFAWIDSSTGTMYGADYVVTYNGASGYSATVDQSSYSEAWAPIGTSLYRTSSVNETDGWGAAYACNSVTGKSVEFDEVKLEI